MSHWKRALLYLGRKRGRTLLLTALLFAMSCFVLVGIFLKNSADRETELLRQSLGSGFILEADLSNELYYETRDGGGYTYSAFVGPDVTKEMLEQIMSMDGVVDYSANLSDSVWVALDLKPGSWAASEPSKDFPEKQLEIWRHCTQVWACRKGELDINFPIGALSISEGRNIEEGDHFKAVISEYFAEKNNLIVGDTITVETKEGMFQPSKEPAKRWGEAIDLEIVGLFQVNFEQTSSIFTPESAHLVNQIYTDLDTHTVLQKNLGKKEVDDSYSKITFFVDDPANLDSIMMQIEESNDIDIEGLLFYADDTAYQASAQPFHLISLFAAMILVIGIVGMGVLLFLVMNLWVKGRIQEAGILLSAGIGKGSILLQMLTECFVISIAALFLALLLSGPLTDTCAETAKRLTSPTTEKEPYIARETLSGEPVVTMVSADEVKLDHSVSFNILVLVVLIVCVTSSVSVLLASIRLLDLEPKRLLQSM